MFQITSTFLKSISSVNSFWFWCLQLSNNFGGILTSKVSTLKIEQKMKTENKNYTCVQCNLLFDTIEDLKKTFASAWRKEVPQLQPVRILKHQSFYYENTHAGSQWGEALCLQTVQLLLHTSCYPQEPHTNPFRKETFQLQTM